MNKMRRYLQLAIILILVMSVVQVVQAKKKKKAAEPLAVTLLSVWTPDEQLVSITTPSVDERTVELQMQAISNVQFWAMEISCIVSVPNAFKDAPSKQTLIPDQDWLEGTGDTFFISTNPNNDFYDAATNRINVAITRVGTTNAPLGLNGATYIQNLFTLRLTVNEGLVGVNTISLNCDTMKFVNRNGVSLGSAVLSSAGDLVVRDGYVLNGNVSRQGSADKSSIQVSCEHQGSGLTYTTLTTSTGDFSFDKSDSGTDPLREQGLYICTYTSLDGGTPDNVYLQGTTYINLKSAQYTIQPVMLRTGDTNEDNFINVANDFSAITVNWQNIVTPYTNGDTNGDGQVDQTDLAITAGNIGLDDDDPDTKLLLDHVLYAVATDYGGTFPNNKLFMGEVYSGGMTQLNENRIFWPQVSPDGDQVAFTAFNTVTIRISKKQSITETVLGLVLANTEDFIGTTIAEGPNFAPAFSPSGNQLAYVCSWSSKTNGYQANNGNICVMNTGKTTDSIKVIIPPNETYTNAEIFPPTWYDETTLVYAGSYDNDICPQELCYYDFLTNTHGLVDIIGIDGVNNHASMPIIVRNDSAPHYLFYQYAFDDGSGVTPFDTELRMGTIQYNSGTNTWSEGVIGTAVDTSLQHEKVELSDGAVYYDVSPTLDVMFYLFNSDVFQNLYLTTGASFTWTAGETHTVDGFVGYPTVDTFDTPQTWVQRDDVPTEFHAFRATFDWIP